jgi:hypothetical protein
MALMQLAPRLPRVPAISGVVLVLVLLAGLPWLPISSSFQSDQPAVHVPASLRTLVQPEVLPSAETYTLHLVGSREQYETEHLRFADPTTDAVILVEGDAWFQRFLTDLNQRRAERGLPPARIEDLRP